MGFELRDYQLRGKTLTQERFAAGDKRIMFWAQTGAGKGFSMSDMNMDALKNGARILNVMKRREVIFQTVKNYKKYHGINGSPIIGNTSGLDLKNPCQIASIDTLRNRIKNPKFDVLKDFDLVVVDECHDFTSSTYKRLAWFLEGYPIDQFDEKTFEYEKQFFKKFYVGLTATPFRVGKKTHTFWDSVVKPIEAHELRDRGLLVPARVYAPRKIDVTGVRITGEDYNQKELFERVSKLQVIGDVVQTYKEYGQNKPALCFCVNQKHSQIMAEAFRRAGIPAIHCDANHTKAERDSAVKGLKDGTYKILTNCDIFSTGFDAPFIEIFIGARPSDSENLVLQQWGRVLRPYKVCANCGTEYGGDPSCYFCGSSITSYEKKEAIILDHANNTDRWGLPYDIRQAELEPIDTARKRSTQGMGVKTCPKCFAVVHNSEKMCVCGHDFVAATQAGGEEEIIQVKGELAELNDDLVREKTYQKIKARYNTYKRLEMLRRWRPESKFYKLYEEFGSELFNFSAAFGIPRSLKKKIEEQQIEKGIEVFLGNFENEKYENAKVFK